MAAVVAVMDTSGPSAPQAGVGSGLPTLPEDGYDIGRAPAQ